MALSDEQKRATAIARARRRRAEAQQGGQPAPEQPAAPARQPAGFHGAADEATHGFTFGLSETVPAAALAGAVGGAKGVVGAVRGGGLEAIPAAIGQEYADIRAGQIADRERFRQEHPGQALAAQVVGGAMGGGKFAGAVKALAPRALAQAPIRTGAAAGAAEVGLYEAGTTDGGFGERLSAGARAAPLGAAIAVAPPSLISGVQRLTPAARRSGRVDQARDKAAKLLTRHLARDLGGKGEAARFIRDWVSKGADPNELIDKAGPDTLTLIREAATSNPTPAMRLYKEFLDNAGDQARSIVDRSVRGGRPGVTETLDTLKEIRSTQAAPLYEEAYAQDIPIDLYRTRLAPLLRERASRAGLNRARKLIDAEIVKETRDNPALARRLRDTRQLIDNWAGGREEMLDTRAIDYITRGIASVEQTQLTASPDLARVTGGVRRAIRETLKDVNEPYRQALDVFAGTKEIETAIDLGRKFTRPSYRASDLARDMASMNENQREFLRVSVAEEFAEKIALIGDRRNKGAFLNNEAMRAKVRTLFGNETEAAEEFVSLVRDMEEQHLRRQTYLDVARGSQTEPLRRTRKEVEDAAINPLSREAIGAAESPGSVPGRVARAMLGRTQEAKVREISDALAEILFERGAASPPTARPVISSPAAPRAALTGVASAPALRE